MIGSPRPVWTDSEEIAQTGGSPCGATALHAGAGGVHPPGMEPRHRVFISYRREDSAGHAGRLADHLLERLGAGSVFMDVEVLEFER